jgi:RimJ/RimL family protein N-acetyltransferase
MPTSPIAASAALLHAQLQASSLRTERLVLRLPCTADTERIPHGYSDDVEAIRWLSFLPHSSIATTETVVAEWLANWERDEGEPMLVIEGADDGGVRGVIGIDIGANGAVIGYVICRHAWGRGFATEVARRAVDLAFEHFGVWRVRATCAPQNLASRRVLEKAGLRHEGVLRRWTVSPLFSPDPRDSHGLAITRDDWLAQGASALASTPLGQRTWRALLAVWPMHRGAQLDAMVEAGEQSSTGGEVSALGRRVGEQHVQWLADSTIGAGAGALALHGLGEQRRVLDQQRQLGRMPSVDRSIEVLQVDLHPPGELCECVQSSGKRGGLRG